MVAHALPVEAAPLIFEPGAYKGRQLSGARVPPSPCSLGRLCPHGQDLCCDTPQKLSEV